MIDRSIQKLECEIKIVAIAVICFLLIVASFFSALVAASPISLGTYPKWGLVELTLQGPSLNGYSGSPNPFSIKLDGVFRGPDGAEYRVPGYYDGNGAGGQSGNVWKIRFTPDQIGVWTVTTVSPESRLHDQIFNFQVEPSSNFGILRYVGGYYLKFLDGPYWLKTGVDDPEEFLGETVFGGWEQKRAAVDYLASRSVNSMYLCLLDYPGDSGLVFPWLNVNDQSHVDLDKMKRWDAMLTYIQSRQIVLNLVLEDDGALIPTDRESYYRNIVARFGYHPGLIWNLREEYNERYSPEQAIEYALLLKEIDPYHHPIALHNVNTPIEWFLHSDAFCVTSIQTDKPSASLLPGQFNLWAQQWRQESGAAGRPIVISYDETGKISSSDKDRSYARKMAWSLVLAGAQFELHTWPLSSYQEFENLWSDVSRLNNFMQRLHFWEMHPRNDLVSANAMAFAKAGTELVAYSTDGTAITVNLSSFIGEVACEWYDPRTGNYTPVPSVPAGGQKTFAPPFGGDNVLHLGAYPNDPTIPQNVVIQNLQPAHYQIDLLQKDKGYYVDRSFTITDLPAALNSLVYIRTADDDKAMTNPQFMSFTVDRPANIYVAYDSRVAAKPRWLTNYFVPTDWSIGVSDMGAYLHVWNRTVAAGQVVLGGNAAEGFESGSGYSMYFVIAQPYMGPQADPHPPSAPQGVTILNTND
jgi:hypothetical protein